MILPYIAASVVVGVAIGAAAGRFAYLAGAIITLLSVVPTIMLLAYDHVVGIQGDPSSHSMMATLAFVLMLPCGLATLATAWFSRE